MRNEIADIIYYLISDPAFWIGGVVVPLIGLAILWLVGIIVEAWNHILQFFQPTAIPGQMPEEQGPSPFAYLTGCLWAIFWLILLVGGIVIVVSWAFVLTQ